MSLNNLRLENALLSDALCIAEMSRDQIEFGLGWSWSQKRVSSAINRRSSTVLKACIGTHFAGFGIMSYKSYKANLNLLATDPRFQRRGIGKTLLQALENEGFDLEIEDFYVQIRERNKAALLFYEQLGYEMIDRNARYYKNKEAGIILYKYCPKNKYVIQ